MNRPPGGPWMYRPLRSTPAGDGTAWQSMVQVAEDASPGTRPSSSSRRFRRRTPTWFLWYPPGESGLGPQEFPGRSAASIRICTLWAASRCADVAGPRAGARMWLGRRRVCGCGWAARRRVRGCGWAARRVRGCGWAARCTPDPGFRVPPCAPGPPPAPSTPAIPPGATSRPVRWARP